MDATADVTINAFEVSPNHYTLRKDVGFVRELDELSVHHQTSRFAIDYFHVVATVRVIQLL